MVIDALITTRILVQFMGQIVGSCAAAARCSRICRGRSGCGSTRCPALVALAGWIFVFATSGLTVILFGVATLAAGVLAFAVWTKSQ